MQRTRISIESRVINDLSANTKNEKSGKDQRLKDGRNAKDFQKFFSSFKRAMKFGSTRAKIFAKNVLTVSRSFRWLHTSEAFFKVSRRRLCTDAGSRVHRVSRCCAVGRETRQRRTEKEDSRSWRTNEADSTASASNPVTSRWTPAATVTARRASSFVGVIFIAPSTASVSSPEGQPSQPKRHKTCSPSASKACQSFHRNKHTLHASAWRRLFPRQHPQLCAPVDQHGLHPEVWRWRRQIVHRTRS